MPAPSQKPFHVQASPARIRATPPEPPPTIAAVCTTTGVPRAREPQTVSWLAVSVVASVVLTVLLNVAIRLFPDASERAGRRLTELAQPPMEGDDRYGGRVRVWAPWKAMLIASLILTVVLNLVLWLF